VDGRKIPTSRAKSAREMGHPVCCEVGILRPHGGCASLAATSLRMTVEFMNLLATDNWPLATAL